MRGDENTILKLYLERLKGKQAECMNLLRTPKTPTEFGYGEACGYVRGLDLAEQLFEEVLNEDKDRT